MKREIISDKAQDYVSRIYSENEYPVGLNDIESDVYEAFSLIARGLSMACKETGRVLNGAVHSQPYIFMAAEAVLLIVLSFVYIGSARAERDHASKQYVRIQHKADSLAVASELWHNLYKKGGAQ